MKYELQIYQAISDRLGLRRFLLVETVRTSEGPRERVVAYFLDIQEAEKRKQQLEQS